MYHSITFGSVINGSFSGKNTWDDWYLIPSSRPTIEQAGISTSFVDIPGRKDGPIDITESMLNRIQYGNRSGTLEFYVDNGHINWETLRMTISNYLHGKHMKMRLEDDPDYYYEGRFSVNEWSSGSWYSKITIGYTLNPFKYKISNGSKYPI